MVRIITDSTSDLSPDWQKRIDVEVLPLTVRFGSQCYLDGVDLTHAEFYDKLASAQALPTTAQPNLVDMASLFQRYRAAGDEVVGIFISSELSGTYQTALLARQAAGEDGIYIVDSRCVTLSMGLLVDQAARLRDAGQSAAQIAEEIAALASRVRLYAGVHTLKYLKMGGRISAATAAVGGVLGVIPMVSVKDGLVHAAGKVRGRKAALEWMIRQVEQDPPDLSLPVCFGHSNSPEAMEEVMTQFADLRARASTVYTGSLGCIVGTYAGPGASGLTYFAKK